MRDLHGWPPGRRRERPGRRRERPGLCPFPRERQAWRAVHAHTLMCAHMCTHICTCTRVCRCTCMHVCTHTCTDKRPRAHTCTVCVYMQAVHTRTQTQDHVRAHARAGARGSGCRGGEAAAPGVRSSGSRDCRGRCEGSPQGPGAGCTSCAR